MAWSAAGRKLIGEALTFVAIIAVGAVVITHRQQAAAMIGLPTQSSNSTKSDDDQAATGTSASLHGGRTVELSAKAHGHFFANAEIDGSSVEVIVDTGASTVTLTYEDARHVGVLPLDSEFTGLTNTANGIARYAPVVLRRVTIGDIEVRNVNAAVMESGKLTTTLLGMSFLSKLSRVDMRAGRLVLEE